MLSFALFIVVCSFHYTVEGQLSTQTRLDLLNLIDPDIPRHLSILGVPEVRVAPNIIIILDCYTYAARLLGNQWDDANTEWSFNNNTIELTVSRRLQVAENKIFLTINRTTLESGAEASTDGLYSCTACSFDGTCETTTTKIEIFAPPVIDTNCEDVPQSLSDSTPFLFASVGCDICLEPGKSIQSLGVSCNPGGTVSRQPISCNWQRGLDLLMFVPGRLDNDFGSLIFTNLSNPLASPEDNFLTTYTCNCSNADGFALASTTIGSCFVAPVISKGTPRSPFRGSLVSRTVKFVTIGSNDSVVSGFDFVIQCRVVKADPPATIVWLRDGMPIEGANHPTLIVHTGDPVAANGTYTCEASNIGGSDSASSNLRYGIELVRAPEIAPAVRRSRPVVNVVGTIQAQVGENVFVIVGERLELFCNLTDPVLPRPRLQWLRNDRHINASTDSEQLVIVNQTSAGDPGNYCCRVRNIAGMSGQCSRVVVLNSGPVIVKQQRTPPPRFPETVTTALTTVLVGGSLWTSDQGSGTISCRVSTANPPLTGIEWLAGSPPGALNATVLGESLFGRIAIDTDLGRMRSTLSIQPTLQSDRQDFTCRATSPAKSDEATTEYGVILPPRIAAAQPTPLPLVVEDESVTGQIGSTLHLAENQTFVIVCRLATQTGLPWDGADFEWFKQDTPLSNSSRFTIVSSKYESRLSVANATRLDGSNYRCFADNPAGSKSAQSRVNVYSVPIILKGAANITIGPEVNQGDIGSQFLIRHTERLFINCDIADSGRFPYDPPNSGVPATILWFRNGEPVDPVLFDSEHGNQLCFNALNSDSGGNFTCRAISRIRRNGTFLEDSASSSVMVVFPPAVNVTAGEQDASGSVDRHISPFAASEPHPADSADLVQYYISNGTSVTLLCAMSGEPRVNFTWSASNATTNELPVTSGQVFVSQVEAGSELLIPDFAAGDEGVYRCRGSNIAGSRDVLFALNICPILPNCSGSGNFTIELKPTPQTQDNCSFCAHYQTTSFGPCSKPCHGGVRTRRVDCRTSQGRYVDAQACQAAMPPPSSSATCQDQFGGVACSLLEPRWLPGLWGKCTRSCGRGLQTRTLHCFRPSSGDYLRSSHCRGLHPPFRWRYCNSRACDCYDQFPSCPIIDPGRCFQENWRIVCCETCLREAPRAFQVK